MNKQHKQYSKPKRPFDKERIIEEAKITKDFGLKNKKEIWRSEAKIKVVREKAKKLISANERDQEDFFNRLRKIGFNVKNIPDVLSLTKEDYLKRRLQNIVASKNLTSTQKGARQLIVHKKVLVGGRVVDSPSYVVPVDLENKISLKQKLKKTQ